MADGEPIGSALAGLALTDHHVHPALGGELSRARFEQLITESGRGAPPGTTQFDSQLGLAVRRWCGPVLGLPPSASPEDYLARRAELGAAGATSRLLRASGIGHFLVDTGYLADGMLGLPAMAEAAGAPVTEIVRLESVAEQLARDGVAAASFGDRFRAALWQRASRAAGVKSIVGYRFGLDIDPAPPGPAELAAAAGGWLREVESTGRARVTDPVLLRHLLWAGVERGLPVQIHTGFGDPDADLRRCDPLLLRGFLELTQDRAVPVMLLHCYPFHRQAGHLAQAYPHVYLDVGLAVNHVGARAAAVVGESMELAPFGKLLFSSDAWGPAELHYLGALLWRRATATVLRQWVEAGEWSQDDAVRVAAMIGSGNARRVYHLT
jgi:predicted TIM-barrel fold metal-dependent hydrolase